MPTLAPKLPYTHPFAGGYPRLGGQPLPTDPDAIDYLERVAAADGAAVEVGVAMAVDDFFKGMKADGIFSAIKAACVLCGARTLSGALVPLVGTAPTNVANNFASGDYDRSSGLKGNGSTKYLDSNRADDADTPADAHMAVYASSLDTVSPAGFYIGAESTNAFDIYQINGVLHLRNGIDAIDSHTAGLLAHSYASGSLTTISGGATNSNAGSARSATNGVKVFVFSRNNATPYRSNARLAFYSIGSALDLAALDNRVSTLVAAIAAAI